MDGANGELILCCLAWKAKESGRQSLSRLQGIYEIATAPEGSKPWFAFPQIAPTKITVEHVRVWRREIHPRYIRLRKSIWLEPYMNDPLIVTVSSVIQVLSDQRQVQP